MSVFVDTGVFVAVRNADDENHRRARELMRSALSGEVGAVHTSDYVIDEAVTLMLRRTKKLELAIDVGEYILKSPRIRKLWVSEDIFESAWREFKSYRKGQMSFTDFTSLVLMEENGIKDIMSFDSGFDGLVSRLHE